MLVDLDYQPEVCSLPAGHRSAETIPTLPISSRLIARMLFHLSRWARRKSAVHQVRDLKRTTNAIHYRQWRSRELKEQLSRHFDTDHVAARDVLDFGCGTGELCHILASYGPKQVIGLDTSPEAIARAAASGSRSSVSIPVSFVQNEHHESIPLPDECIDLVCCFDVVEHIPDPRAVLAEWARVLRPGGRVWIWWSPWRGPYGHHLESLIPLPWVHLIVGEKPLFAACAAVYDDPGFVPRIWDQDPMTGRKKPNKWLTTQSFYPFLNRLTRRRFEQHVSRSGLTVWRREIHGFSGSKARRATRGLLRFPLIGDCVVSYYVYELTRR